MTLAERPEQADEWPSDGDFDIVLFIVESRNRFEATLVDERLAQLNWRTSVWRTVDAKASALAQVLSQLPPSKNIWLQPLRISWLEGQRTQKQRPRLRDVFLAEPGWLRQRYIAARRPERIHLLSGDGAILQDVANDFSSSRPTENDSKYFAGYVVRRAIISLERAERSLRGARYKIAKLLSDDIFNNDEFQDTLASLAKEQAVSLSDTRQQANTFLHEMGALQTPFTLDLMTTIERKVLSVNHDPITDVNAADMEKIAAMLKKQPVVFLISHKSMLDIAAFLVALYDADIPLPLTFGGINLNTPGFGALARRAGVIFLRRSFQDEPLYKATFRRYIDYLIEKRFSLQWALEGTRSRTGKLLPPRFGLFNYVVESILRTGSNDVAFVPVSVAFDQITEVADYAREHRGLPKKREGATWFLRFFRRKAPHGRIFIRFGNSVQVDDIVSIAKLQNGLEDKEKTALVQNLAFRVAVNMNAATPITTSAIITLILLAGGKRAQSLAEIQLLARSGAAMMRRRRLEIVGSADFKNSEDVVATLSQLTATGIISQHTDGVEPLYSISEDQHHNAAYYRNTAIHYFVLDAIFEVALLHCAEFGLDDEDTLLEFAGRLREILKFEFYFPRRSEYAGEILQCADGRFKDWRLILGDAAKTRQLLAGTPPLLGHAVLRSFVDAYRIAALNLAHKHDQAVTDKAVFIAECLPLGRQLHLQGRVFSGESVSKVLFETAYRLFEHEHLLEADKHTERENLLHLLRSVCNRLQVILDTTLAQADAH